MPFSVSYVMNIPVTEYKNSPVKAVTFFNAIQTWNSLHTQQGYMLAGQMVTDMCFCVSCADKHTVSFFYSHIFSSSFAQQTSLKNNFPFWSAGKI